MLIQSNAERWQQMCFRADDGNHQVFLINTDVFREPFIHDAQVGLDEEYKDLRRS